MDQELLVDTRIEDGQKLIDQLVRDGFPVRIALWVKPDEEASWYLYIASPSVDFENFGKSYGALYVSHSKIPDCSIDLSEIKLINGTNSIARDALALRGRYAGRGPIKLHGKRVGNLSVEEAYIYPPPEKWFQGLDEIKRQFPSAEVFSFYVISKDVIWDEGMKTLSPFFGKINANEFEGKAPGTVLFMGPEASSAKPLASLVFVYRPEGWNTMFHPGTNRWEEVRFASTGQPIYHGADFSPLASLKTTRKPYDDFIETIKQGIDQGYYLMLPPDPTIIDKIPYSPSSRSETLPPGIIDWETIRQHIEEGGKVVVRPPNQLKA